MESLVIKGFPLQGLIAHYNALHAPWVTFSADARNALWGHTIDHAEMVHPQILSDHGTCKRTTTCKTRSNSPTD